MRKILLLAASHLLVLAVGIALGIYLLPILIAPPAPSAAELGARAAQATFTGEFRRDLQDSDAFHWGEGSVAIAPDAVVHRGRLAPGPDYKLYLSPGFVQTEADFARLKPGMLLLGDVKTFDGFIVPVPAGVDPARYTSVVVWCESFSQFITAARYR